MKILVIDNYDSFTFNLVHLIGVFTHQISVYRNDRINIKKIESLAPDAIVISPGPGRPEDSGISLPVIGELGSKIPTLGVCLGHQGIGYYYGCRIEQAPSLMHGKVSRIRHDNKTIYQEIPQEFIAGRYHSLVVARNSIPPELEISAETSENVVMGLRHKQFPLEGIQFHPESILTDFGEALIKNWIEYYV